MDIDSFHRLLELSFEKGVSDIHFEVGDPPLLRVRGQLIRSKLEKISSQDTEFIVSTILESRQTSKQSFAERLEIDTSYSIGTKGRFRVSIFRQKGHFGVVMRAIPSTIKSFQNLNLPSVLADIATSPYGLILVTGPTGNGKSTTLAAMIQHVNETSAFNIITIEDPIEFIFTSHKSVVVQREVGIDTLHFSDALRSAMRMDPDVVMVGEMRDLETIDACIKAAETGHLVFSTLHTNSAVQTINRLLAYFPDQSQTVVRQRLSDILVATISLRLLLTANQNALMPVVEIMRSTTTIQACIRDGRLDELQGHIEQGKQQYQMQTMDQHLLDLCRQKIITVEQALHVTRSSDLERNLLLEQ